jgi:predicted amidophosphoribosyltransferase
MNKAEKFEYETADRLCELCRLPLGYSDDNWDGLCPGCADELSDYLDHHGLCDEDRDDAVARLTQIRQKRSRIMAAVKSKKHRAGDDRSAVGAWAGVSVSAASA